ncbi:MAG: hypothetical protein Fur0032_10480 [Terrimicrobiaceae bacterium]
MSPLKFLFLGAFVAAGSLHAQQLNPEFRISKIDVAFQDTPDIGGSGYGKRVRKAGTWLEVETTFDWIPSKPDQKFLDELTVNYFILLKNPTADSPKGTLLTGSANHVLVSAGKDKKSVVYVAPRVLEKLFDGKLPGTVGAAVAGVGVEIRRGGEVVAEQTTQGRGAWWREGFEPVSGMVLDKSKTPFAHMAWDYHEPLKSSAAN